MNNKINDKIQVLKKELAELEALSNKKNRWRAELGDSYFYIDDCGCVSCSSEDNHKVDNFRYNIGNYFKTEQEVQKEIDKTFAITKVNDKIMELNKGWVLDWNNSGEGKYYIYFNCASKILEIDYFCHKKEYFVLNYMQSSEIAEKIIEEFTPELNLIFNILIGRK